MAKKNSVHLIWIFVLLVVGVILWKLWIPELIAYEAPRWDESDRAQDAFLIAQGLRHFNPLPLLHQLAFFQTWGPGFALAAQIPILLFGFHAHSLTLVAFLSLIFGCLGFASVVKVRAGWATAVAVVAFSTFWILNTPEFSPYYSVFLIDGWSIVGWTGIAIAGAVGSVNLLVASAWLLFAMKFQYYAVLFLASLAYLLIVARRKLIPFLKELLVPLWAKIVFAIVALAAVHVLIMKAFGPIYGQSTWDQPRAIRNPVLYAFLLTILLLILRRDVFFKWLVEKEWERKFINWFLLPTSLFMAMPWPNRWAAVMVTQNQQDNRGFVAKVSVYSQQITAALHWPVIACILLAVLIIMFFVTVFRNRSAKLDVRSVPFFISLMICVHLFVLLGAVKHMDIRYALSLFLSIPIGLFAAILFRMPEKRRTILGALSAIIFAAMFFIQNPMKSPTNFFTGRLAEYINKSQMEHANLYPLDQSLGPLLSKVAHENSVGAASDRKLKLGILSDTLEWDWNLTMRLWPSEFEAHSGIWVEPVIVLDSTNYCATAAAEKLDVFLKAGATSWETVPCEHL
jgi:hypothetical protein